MSVANLLFHMSRVEQENGNLLEARDLERDALDAECERKLDIAKRAILLRRACRCRLAARDAVGDVRERLLEQSRALDEQAHGEASVISDAERVVTK